MLKRFLNIFRVKLPESDRIDFNKQLDLENAERVFIISFLGVLFFVLLLILDIQRIQSGKFDQSYFYQVSMFLHMSLGLFILPAFLIQNHSEEIAKGTYKYTRIVVYGAVAMMAAILVPMALFATIDRNSLITFVVYMIFVNLFLTLPKKMLLWINFFSIIAIAIGVYIIEKNNPIILTAALIEALGIIIPVFIISLYQYNSRVRQFNNERKIQEQNALLQKGLEDEFNKRLLQIEMRALRAQMNPHFIFNVLNSIKLYMVQNDAKTAANYLTKFSKLIRLILNNSQSQMIMLEDELKALKLYIEIENFRFNNKFDYKIEIANNIDEEFVELPPLILQPYVENAIWHGLLHKKDERGLLQIKIELLEKDTEEMLLFTIEDNGIGREKAAEMKSNTARKAQHKSVGMDLTRDRIEMTNQFYGINATVKIVDLEKENGDAAGTKVVLTLPVT